MSLPTREKALEILNEYVLDDYQVLHAKMVATALAGYATKYNEDEDLWYITGLLHDLDYYKHPELHPARSLVWFKQWEYPESLIHAVAAHGISTPRIEPESNLAKALIATDELCGIIYANSLMRPTGMDGMNTKSVMKKIKDKAFAAKIDRAEIQYGVDLLGIDLKEHITNVLRFLSDSYS